MWSALKLLVEELEGALCEGEARFVECPQTSLWYKCLEILPIHTQIDLGDTGSASLQREMTNFCGMQLNIHNHLQTHLTIPRW